MNKRKFSNNTTRSRSASAVAQGGPSSKVPKREPVEEVSPFNIVSNTNDQDVTAAQINYLFNRKTDIFARMPAAEYILHKGGNLYIQLNIPGSSPIRFLVVSETLCLASNHWAGLILGPESRTESRKLPNDGAYFNFLDVFHDDPEALLVLFHIIHHDIDKVPRKLSFEQLRSIAMLCDKYECVKALGLWKEYWLDSFGMEDRLRSGYEDWLGIDAIFGNKGFFLKLMTTIIKESRLGPEEQETRSRNLFRFKRVVHHGNGNRKEGPDDDAPTTIEQKFCIPLRALADIRIHREETIWELIQVAKRFMRHLEPYSGDGAPRYDCKEKCLSMAYGCFARSAHRLGIWHWFVQGKKQLGRHTESPEELYDKLMKIQFCIPSEPRPCDYARQECGLRDIHFDFDKALDGVMNQLLSMDVDQYMKSRDERQGRWEMISLPGPPSLEARMNNALQNKGR